MSYLRTLIGDNGLNVGLVGRQILGFCEFCDKKGAPRSLPLQISSTTPKYYAKSLLKGRQCYNRLFQRGFTSLQI